MNDLLRSHRGRLDGMRCSALSNTAHLFRPDLYMVVNDRSWFSYLDTWVTDKDCGKYVLMCRALRGMADEAGFPVRARFAILDSYLEADAKTHEPHPGKRKRCFAARTLIERWLTEERFRIENVESDPAASQQQDSLLEGQGKIIQKHVGRERRNRSEYIRLMLRDIGHIPTNCDVCSIDPEKTFAGFAFALEVHHIIFLQNGQRKTKAADLRLLCPNCHRAAHRWSAQSTVDSKPRSDREWHEQYHEFTKSARACFRRSNKHPAP